MASVASRIGPADHGRAIALDEFLEAEEEPGYRYELSRGVLEVTQVPNDAHGQIVCNLYTAIVLYEQTHPGLIQRYGGAGEFQLLLPGMISGRNPDVAVVLKGTPKDPRGRRPPSLAIEVVSAGSETRDYHTKREEYLAYGLREYWIVDPQARKVTVLLRDGSVWVERVFQGEQVIESLVLPGFGARVDELWVDAESDEGVESDEPDAMG
jgi:Uma2 family endonuclease